MTIQKFTISNDPDFYEAWPDVVLTDSGKLICVFTECTHHGDHSHSCIMLIESVDRGRTWSQKYPLTEETGSLSYHYNCARISKLSDGRLVISLDRAQKDDEADESFREEKTSRCEIFLYFSSDDGESWSEKVPTPARGIVPDKLIELDNGRWLLASHYCVNEKLTEFLHWLDDQGKPWSQRVTVAASSDLNLCEGSLLPLGDGKVVAFMRENSWLGMDCKKVISEDNGETWGEILDFPVNGCHRPTTGWLNNGQMLLTCRLMPGGGGWVGHYTQNLLAVLTDRESVLTDRRRGARIRILPIDFDRSPHSDTGYSGWVQFPDGEIYIVNYIVDDAWDKAQIRGYSLHMEDFLLTQK